MTTDQTEPLTLIDPPPVCRRCWLGFHVDCMGWVRARADSTYRLCACCGQRFQEVEF